jgi:hypothetical protein
MKRRFDGSTIEPPARTGSRGGVGCAAEGRSRPQEQASTADNMGRIRSCSPRFGGAVSDCRRRSSFFPKRRVPSMLRTPKREWYAAVE